MMFRKRGSHSFCLFVFGFSHVRTADEYLKSWVINDRVHSDVVNRFRLNKYNQSVDFFCASSTNSIKLWLRPVHLMDANRGIVSAKIV